MTYADESTTAYIDGWPFLVTAALPQTAAIPEAAAAGVAPCGFGGTRPPLARGV